MISSEVLFDGRGRYEIALSDMTRASNARAPRFRGLDPPAEGLNFDILVRLGLGHGQAQDMWLRA